MTATPYTEDPEDPHPRSGNADYDALPVSVKDRHSFESWQWLSESDKGVLVQAETEPEF